MARPTSFCAVSTALGAHSATLTSYTTTAMPASVAWLISGQRVGEVPWSTMMPATPDPIAVFMSAACLASSALAS